MLRATQSGSISHKEILLLGQNVAAYGLNGDIRPPADGFSPFAELLEALNDIPGLARIRYTSPYVSYFNDRLIAALASCKKVCHNIHLPLQSGSDRILQAMNRQYTAQSYREKVAQLRAAVPDLTFSTDVIVGFPGEEESDFALTRELMNEVGFEQAYIFKYSPRPGAKSALLADTVSEEEKLRRNNILLDEKTNEGACVIDLDTVMPGLVHYDFGDMVRGGTGSTAEDEVDDSKVYMRKEMFEGLLKGYLESAKNFLTPTETELLPLSGKIITLEIGTRFLADYLNGDVYFKTSRPNHNLDRARVQIALGKSIGDALPELMKML